MNPYAVHWHEGMFLRPQHFQMAQRHWSFLSSRGEQWDCHYNWGLRSFDLDLDALANYRVVIRSLRARMPDGTQISIPEDGTLSPLPLKHALERNHSLTVYLAVPALQWGRDNLHDGGRWLIEDEEMEDENTGVNPQIIPVRRLNTTLLPSTQDLTGYDVLPLLRVAKSTMAEALPELDESYIPPLLACEAWRPLQTHVLHNVYDRIGKKIALLAEQVKTRGITFDSHTQGDAQVFYQLRLLNEAYAVLGVLGAAQGIPPFDLYLELSRIAGQLAIFGPTRRLEDLPLYDHDDLGGCFFKLKQNLDGLLNVFVEPEYKERALLGSGLRMQTSLEPAWLEPGWEMYLGVKSHLEANDCIALLTEAGRLDMKMGSSDRVDAIFRGGEAGLQFSACAHAPRALPNVPGQFYFRLEREASGSEWQTVQRSLSLALRVNESLLTGELQGQRLLTIRSGEQTTTLQFTLYVIEKSKS